MVDIFAIIIPFLTAVLILLIIFASKYFRDKSKNEVIMKAIENGVELSPDIFKTEPVEKKSKKQVTDPLTSSLVTIGAGIGIFIALYFFFNELRFAAFGVIPLFVGLGQLIGYFVNKKHKRDNKEQNNMDV